MKVNVYGSDGKPFNEEQKIFSFEELADMVSSRYQLESEFDVLNG